MGVMGATQNSRLVVSLLALALAFAIGSLPTAAQSGSEAVVCVGSETRTLATNSIRRVFTEHMEVVYRTGVDIGERAQIERTLNSELGSYPEVWCAWSDPGDDHAVIVSYTGVIRPRPFVWTKSALKAGKVHHNIRIRYDQDLRMQSA